MLLNLDKWGLLNGPVNKLFKKNIIIDNNILFDERIAYGEDTKFTFEYITYCNNFYFIPKHHYHYIHRNGEGLTNRKYNYEQWLNIAKMLVEVRKPASIRFSFNSEHIDYIQHVYVQYIIMGIRSLYNKPTKKKLNKRIAIFRNQELLEISQAKNIYGISQIRLSYLLRYPILFDAIMCLSSFLKHPII